MRPRITHAMDDEQAPSIRRSTSTGTPREPRPSAAGACPLKASACLLVALFACYDSPAGSPTLPWPPAVRNGKGDASLQFDFANGLSRAFVFRNAVALIDGRLTFSHHDEPDRPGGWPQQALTPFRAGTLDLHDRFVAYAGPVSSGEHTNPDRSRVPRQRSERARWLLVRRQVESQVHRGARSEPAPYGDRVRERRPRHTARAAPDCRMKRALRARRRRRGRRAALTTCRSDDRVNRRRRRCMSHSIRARGDVFAAGQS